MLSGYQAPLSDDDSRSQSPDLNVRPTWSRHQSSASNQTRTLQGRATHLARTAVAQAFQLIRYGLRIWHGLSLWQRFLAVLVGIVGFVFAVLFLIYNEAIFSFIEPYAERWRAVTGGWLVVWFAIIVAAMPPLIGYSTLLTIAGFVYGFPNGWFIAASANVIGATLAFILSRRLFSGYVTRLTSKSQRFAALGLVLQHDGLFLLVLLRLCPLPYSLSNGFMSTFATVDVKSFALACAIASPKLLIHIFIGSRLAAIAKSGDQMDAGTKAINWISIIVGVLLGILTGWLIYSRTMRRARQLEAEEDAKLLRRNTTSNGLRDPNDFADEDADAVDLEAQIPIDETDFLDSEAHQNGRDDEHDPWDT